MQGKPSHYFVIRSPYAQLVLTGVKTFEWRTNAKMFANKRLAVAVSKSRVHKDDLQNDIAKWEKLWSKFLKKATAKDRETALEKLKKKRAKAEKLLGKTNGCGMIIGEIVTGDVATYEGLLGIPVLDSDSGQNRNGLYLQVVSVYVICQARRRSSFFSILAFVTGK